MSERPETIIHCTRAIRDLWPDPLASQWLAPYPELFDEDDMRLTTTQPRNHFCEWFAAIHLFQRDGALSLVEKYVYAAHPHKVARLYELLSDGERATLDDICARFGVQPPDLLAYTPGTKRYWFAEVKGPGDRPSPQQTLSHQAIAEELGVPVEVIRVRVSGGV